MNELQQITCPASYVYSIPGDGNCQFSALSWACYGTMSRQRSIRHAVCDYIEENWDVYKESVTDNDLNYVSRMRHDGQWGDNITLDAFCNCYGLSVAVLRPNDKPWFFSPRGTSVEGVNDYRTVVYSNGHYNACDPWFTKPTLHYIDKWRT